MMLMGHPIGIEVVAFMPWLHHYDGRGVAVHRLYIATLHQPVTYKLTLLGAPS